MEYSSFSKMVSLAFLVAYVKCLSHVTDVNISLIKIKMNLDVITVDSMTFLL